MVFNFVSSHLQASTQLQLRSNSRCSNRGGMLVAIYRAAEILHKIEAHVIINGLVSMALVQGTLSSYHLEYPCAS